jgi:hypothetical protein
MQITIALFKGAEASTLRMCKHLLKAAFDPETLSKGRCEMKILADFFLRGFLPAIKR